MPDGQWWGFGVYTTTHVSGDMRSPQICRNGRIWGQTVDGSSSTTLSGSKDSYGSYNCPTTNFCQNGLLQTWTAGYKCSVENLHEPEICHAGLLSAAGKDQCDKWIIGTFWPFLATVSPVKCSRGSVWRFNSQIGISTLCPAGAYCTYNTVTTRVNTSVIEHDYIPIYCNAGTYCLSGVFTPTIDSNNPRAGQSCIEGLYCPEGTDSASGLPCPEGNYWPSRSVEPIPTDVGYFASGGGDVQQEPCPQGTYSNITEAPSCITCPAGFECTCEATVVPVLWPAGTYKPLNADLIFWQSWPQGTWSNVTGLSDVNNCQECKPAIVCIVEGMTSLDQAIDCTEGYVCPNSRTTSFTMFDIPCPEGYYCGARTATEDQYRFCDDGLYCPTASTSTGRTQNRCLAGYFWPLGTAARLNSDGNFEEAYQIGAAYNFTNSDQYEKCATDSPLPSYLIETYINGGRQLRWPQGTTSSRGAHCISNCTIPSVSTVVASYNPINGSETSDGVVNGFGESSSNRRLNEDDSFFNDLYKYQLKPLHSAKIKIDFRDFPEGFNYDEHFKIDIRDGSNTSLTLPRYFTLDNNIADKNKRLEIRIHNMKNIDQNFTFSIKLLHGLFEPFRENFTQKVAVFLYRSDRAKLNSDNTYGFIISSTFLEGIKIPYNAPDVENDQSLFLDMTAKLGLLPTRSYNKDVYDTTYWQSRQITSAIMSWIPFFSNWEEYDNRILFYDLVEGNSQWNLPEPQTTKIVELIPVTGFTPVADKCNLNIQCRYDEVIGFGSGSSKRWYEIKEKQTVFLVTRDPITSGKFFSRSGGLETGFVNAISDADDSLVKAEIKPQASSGTPKNVKLKMLYYQMSKTQKRIVIATVELSNYEVVTTQDEATYTLNVEYRAMTFFELISNFQFSVFIYMLLFSMITIVLFITIIIVWVFKILIARRKKPPVIKFMHMARVTFGPPTIGVSISSITTAIVLLILAQDLTVFDDTAAGWKNQQEELSEAQKIADKRGRLGLQFIIVGFVCLFYGANTMILKPSTAKEKEIIECQKQQRIKEQIDASIGESQSSYYRQKEKLENKEDREEDIKTRSAISWKRKHFLVICMVITIGLLIKLKFSYTTIFSENIYTFLIVFMIMDIILEQLLSRVIMAETILVAPVLGAFVITEFITTMGAEDFYNFIVSYFIETSLVVSGRIYIGPAVERIEFYSQRFAIWLSLKFDFAEKIFRKFLEDSFLFRLNFKIWQSSITSIEIDKKKLVRVRRVYLVQLLFILHGYKHCS